MGARAHVYVLRLLALLMCSLLKYLWNKPYKQSDSCDALGFRAEHFPGIQLLLYRLDDRIVKGSVRRTSKRSFKGGPMNSVWRRFDILRHFEWIKLKMSSWWGGTGRNCFQALPVVITRSKVILYLTYGSGGVIGEMHARWAEEAFGGIHAVGTLKSTDSVLSSGL